MDNRPIGIFDSGVGGLTVVSEVMKALPFEDIIYFGDTARVPYGSKSKDTVTRFSRQIMNFLLTKDVKAVIIACNTVSSNSYSELAAEFSVPLVEVVSPGVDSCLKTTKNNVVGVIGTEATISSGVYEKLLKERQPSIKVFSQPCPLFVPLAEEGWVNNDVTLSVADIYLSPILDKGIDSLILGCTHYPLLTDCIVRLAPNISIVNPAWATALKMKEFLSQSDMLREVDTPPSHTFYASDNTNKFDRTCKTILNKVFQAQIIDIEE